MDKKSVFEGYLVVQVQPGQPGATPGHVQLSLVDQNDLPSIDEEDKKSKGNALLGLVLDQWTPSFLFPALSLSPGALIFSKIISKAAQRIEASGYIPKRAAQQAEDVEGSISKPKSPANSPKTDEMFSALNRAIPLRIAEFECPTCQSTSYKHHLQELSALPNGDYEFKIELECQNCQKRLRFQETLQNILGALGIEITVPGGISLKIGK